MNLVCRLPQLLLRWVFRALGDFDYKQVRTQPAEEQLVSPEPDVTIMARDKEQDQMMILACDGVWDVFSNEDLGEYLVQRLRCAAALSQACEETLDTSLFKVTTPLPLCVYRPLSSCYLMSTSTTTLFCTLAFICFPVSNSMSFL